MAFARDSYTATGGQTDFTISFPYLADADVNVSVNGTALDQDADADTGSFQIVASTTARIGAGLTLGDAVVITRTTSQSTRLVDYASGSTLTEEDLDDDSLQAFYMAQEAIDDANINNSWQELTTAVSVGTSTAVTLTSALAAQDPYMVMLVLHDVSTGTDNSTLDLRLGPAAGLLTTGYDSIGWNSGASARTSTTGICLTGTAATWDAADDLSGIIILEKLGSGDLWTLTSTSGLHEPGGTAIKNMFMEPFDVTGTLDEIGLVCSNNMNAGTVDIYYKA
jgi:hypothetical protein